MMPKLACGPPRSALDRVSARKARAASSACPAFSASSATSNSRCTVGLMPEGVSFALDAAAPGDCAGAAGCGDCAGFSGATEAQPAMAAHSAPSRPQRRSRSANRIDRNLAALGFRVAHRPQLAQPHVALPDPLVVDAAGAVARVHLVQLDRLFLERVGLLLQHHVV